MKRLLLVLAALSISAAAFAADLPPGKWWRRAEVVQNLGLTDDQQNRLENVWRAAAADLIDFRAEVEKNNIALRAEMDRSQIDRRAVQAAASRLSTARARLFERELMMFVDMRAVLSDSQWARMRAFLDRVEANRPLQQQRRRQQ